MRLFWSETGRRLHIVRECAWHGTDGTRVTGLCGALPDRNGVWVAASENLGPSPCKTCLRLRDGGAA